MYFLETAGDINWQQHVVFPRNSLYIFVCVCMCVFLSVFIRGTVEVVFQEFEVCYVMVSYVRCCSAWMHGVHVRMF